jgi:hypothetical protein
LAIGHLPPLADLWETSQVAFGLFVGLIGPTTVDGDFEGKGDFAVLPVLKSCRGRVGEPGGGGRSWLPA